MRISSEEPMGNLHHCSAQTQPGHSSRHEFELKFNMHANQIHKEERTQRTGALIDLLCSDKELLKLTSPVSHFGWSTGLSVDLSVGPFVCWCRKNVETFCG